MADSSGVRRGSAIALAKFEDEYEVSCAPKVPRGFWTCNPKRPVDAATANAPDAPVVSEAVASGVATLAVQP